VNTDTLFDTRRLSKAILVLIVCLALLVGAVVIAWLVQRDWGHVQVTNAAYDKNNRIPISTWFYQLTGKIYLGALLNAALVAWMFTSSQVIASIPV